MNEIVPPFVLPETGQVVRVLHMEGEPWWIARDVLDILGIGNTTEAMRGLDDDEFSTTEVVDSVGRCQPNTYVVNEPGLYSLILRSRKPQAKAFKRWITHEVLPAVRKTGRYEAQPARSLDPLERLRQSHEDLGQALAIADAEKQRADAAEAEADLLRDRALVADAITEGMGLTPTEFRRSYFPDVAERVFFGHLYRRGYLIDQRGKRRGENGEPKDGLEHGHPGSKGNAYLYLHSPWVDENGRRRGRARVRPGQNELDFVAQLKRDGLEGNRALIQQPRELSTPTPKAIVWEGPPPIDFELYRNRSA